MTASTRLRVLASPTMAHELVVDPALAGRSEVVMLRRGVEEATRTAQRGKIDVALIRSGSATAAVTATMLRSVGVTVWWIDALRSPCPGLGAPAHTSTWLDLPSFERVAELAGRPGAGRTDGPAVSVVVTTLNEGISLDAVIDGIAAQLGRDDELVVVDGGSTDGSVEGAQATWAHEPRVRITVVPGAGISTGRNIGVELAVNDVILCTDAGCEIRSGWVDGMRRAMAGDDRPGLVSGTYRPTGNSALATAQALACYPDPHEVSRPDVMVRAYTRIFGTGFHPAYAVGRNVAFTREAWTYAGGFPEHLATGEDVSFGLAVARGYRCAASADSRVDWQQRDTLGATWRMYRSYGRASTDGGDIRLLARDGIRGVGYVLAAAAATTPRGRLLAAIGALAYISLPVRRGVRSHARLSAYPLLPIALATKDVGKITGAVEGLVQRWRASR